MNLKKRRFLGGFNRFRLMLTLGLAVLLPAAANHVSHRTSRRGSATPPIRSTHFESGGASAA